LSTSSESEWTEDEQADDMTKVKLMDLGEFQLDSGNKFQTGQGQQQRQGSTVLRSEPSKPSKCHWPNVCGGDSGGRWGQGK
jgi:hypothetical protein